MCIILFCPFPQRTTQPTPFHPLVSIKINSTKLSRVSVCILELSFINLIHNF